MVIFERLVSRGVVRQLSNEIDLAGVKTTVETTLQVMISGGVAIFFLVACILFGFRLNAFIDVMVGLLCASLFIAIIYIILEYKIEGRKLVMEQMLPDYLQITAANLRSGVSLDRAMLMAAKPEFLFLAEDVKEMNRRIFGGESFEAAIKSFASRYRSYQLNHAVKMILESLRYGGAVADLLQQISKDLRAQQLMQKEIAGQMLMYSIFIIFAGVIVAPALYGLTSQMIKVTDTIWVGILNQNPGGLPTAGISFLKPSAPQISAGAYYNFSVASIIIITAFASLIASAIQSGSAVKGVKYAPVAVAVGVGIFFAVNAMVGLIFTHVGGA